MSKIKIAEIFYTLQGESKFIGVPSVFIRTFGCNFRCKGFGLPLGQLTDEPERILKNLRPDQKYINLPLAKSGCDSYAAVYPAFKHLSPMMTVDEIVVAVSKTYVSANADSVHIVITGGEPLLGWQRSYPELLSKLKALGHKHFTFETNGTQHLHTELTNYFKESAAQNSGSLTFSVSPKLPCSGEKVEDALRPDVIKEYSEYGDVYLKFVVGQERDMKDVKLFVNEYKSNGFTGEVYLMPVGGVADLYNLTAPQVAKYCMEKGYRYSPRLQVDLFGNQWGT